MIRQGNNIFNIGGSIPCLFDLDASKVIEAVRSTGVVITPAMRHYAHYLISNMKNIGTWQLSNAVYGVVGGTAASHKWNWKDLRDVDAAFRLSFGAGTIHSSTGALATTNNTNTFLNPNGIFTTNIHMSYYSGTNANPLINVADMGFYGGSAAALYISIKRQNGINTGYSAFAENASGVLTAYLGRSDGYFIGNRESNSLSYFLGRGGIMLTKSTVPGGTVPNGNIAIMGNAGTSITISPRECRLATIGFGFTSLEQTQKQQDIGTNAQLILNRA